MDGLVPPVVLSLRLATQRVSAPITLVTPSSTKTALSWIWSPGSTIHDDHPMDDNTALSASARRNEFLVGARRFNFNHDFAIFFRDARRHPALGAPLRPPP
jgi:hypothetical protein